MTATDSAIAARSSRRRPIGAAWVAVVAAAEVLAVVANVGAPIQPALAIVFVLTCPGFLILDLRQPPDLSARVVLGIGASLAVNLVVFTLGLVGNISWIAPVLALVLLGIAVMPKDRIRAGLQRMPSLTSGAGGTPEPNTPAPRSSSPGPEEAPATVPDHPAAAGTNAVAAAGEDPDSSAATSAADDAVTAVAAGTGGVSPGAAGGTDLDEPVKSDSKLMDINTASLAELSTLPGIGPEIASRIVVYRYSSGGFDTTEDLLNVAGVGPSTFTKLRDRVVVKTPDTPTTEDEER